MYACIHIDISTHLRGLLVAGGGTFSSATFSFSLLSSCSGPSGTFCIAFTFESDLISVLDADFTSVFDFVCDFVSDFPDFIEVFELFAIVVADLTAVLDVVILTADMAFTRELDCMLSCEVDSMFEGDLMDVFD